MRRTLDGGTALWQAARGDWPGAADCVSALLGAGANPNLPTRTGSTLAIEACRSGNDEVLRLALRYNTPEALMLQRCDYEGDLLGTT